MCTKSAGAVVAVIFLTAAFAFADSGKIDPTPGKYCGHRASAVVASPSRGDHLSLDDYYPVMGPIPIPDNPGDNSNDTAISVVNIPDSVTITDLNVRMVISHSWVRDLYITLTGPEDTTALILLNLLPQDGADTLDGWFDDEAGVSITDPDAPLIGEWRPQESLSRYDGRNAQGSWTLRVWDRFAGDSGYVAEWGVDVNPVYNLEGTVTNRYTRTPVRGAHVLVEELSLDRETDALGQYAFLTLPTGTYTISFFKDSLYETLRVPGQEIESHVLLTLDTLLGTVPGYYEYASQSDPVSIPDSGGGAGVMRFSVRTSEAVTINDLDVTINVNHTYDNDLLLYLISPLQDTIVLADQVGGPGDGFVECRFDDEAGTAIGSGTAPFTGSFQPVDTLSIMNGQSTAGSWQFVAVDNAALDTGSIQNFTLNVHGEPTAVDPNDRVNLPTSFRFSGSFPNPFNATTVFRFSLSRQAAVTLILYNTLGQEAAQVIAGDFAAGEHEVYFNGSALASGIYLARMTSGNSFQTRKIVLLK